MTDRKTGELKQDILKEKILSAIVEIKTPLSAVEEVLDTVQKVSRTIDTVVAVGISTRCDEMGEDRMLAPVLQEMGYTFERAKTNMGLGRVTNVQKNVQKTEARSDQHPASVR
jgi:hypothetical protein